MDAYEKVKLARKVDRPTSSDFINRIFKNFIEFSGDRNFGDDKAIVGGIATLSGMPVTVIGIQRGVDLASNMETNFGQVHPEGYRKALRLMKQAEKFKRPVICFINTAGAFCGKSAEARGQGEAIARNLYEMSTLKVPIISIITGEGGSGGALALAVADKVWILENAVYSVLSPEGFASILFKDGSRAKESAEMMKLTAEDLLELEVVDKVIEEDEVFKNIKRNLILEIRELQLEDTATLIENRYNRFRKFGEFE